MTNVFITNLALPFTGVFISLLVYLIGMWLFKISNGFSRDGIRDCNFSNLGQGR